VLGVTAARLGLRISENSYTWGTSLQRLEKSK
jgi:hypothetical protein